MALVYEMGNRKSSVGQDVYEHVCGLWMLPKDGISGFQLRVPRQAAALQQRDRLVIDDLDDLVHQESMSSLLPSLTQE
jgi:hypothetical protein